MAIMYTERPNLRYDIIRRSDGPEEFSSHFDELCAFFRDAYGEGYNGDESLAKKLDESDTIARLHRGDTLVAATLSGLGRMTTIGSASFLNKEAREDSSVATRFDTMVQLLRSTRATEGIDWISVGAQYDRMSSAVALSGLRRINCEDRIESLLDMVNESNRYDIMSIEDSRVIVKNGYVQKVYAKEGCACDGSRTDRHMFE